MLKGTMETTQVLMRETLHLAAFVKRSLHARPGRRARGGVGLSVRCRLALLTGAPTPLDSTRCCFMSLFLHFFLCFLCVRHATLRLSALMNPPNAAAVLYRYRAHLPVPDRLRAIIPNCPRENYEPLSTFSDQAAAGMTSSTFDIEADNIFQGDTRAGLDEQGIREVMEIMRRENVK
jgi:Fungal protein of unknown function (DUF2015)